MYHIRYNLLLTIARGGFVLEAKDASAGGDVDDGELISAKVPGSCELFEMSESKWKPESSAPSAGGVTIGSFPSSPMLPRLKLGGLSNSEDKSSP